MNEPEEILKPTCRSCRLIGTVCLCAHPDDEICDEDFEPWPNDEGCD